MTTTKGYSKVTRDFLNQVEELKNDENKTRELYLKIVVPYQWLTRDEAEAKTTQELRELILENEHRGKTGFDCGFSTISVSNRKENKDFIADLGQILKNDEDDLFAKRFLEQFRINSIAYYDEHLYELSSRESLLPVQSTTIQEAELNFLIDSLPLDLLVTSIID